MSSSLPVPLLRCPFDALTLDMISGAAVFVDREDGVTKAQKPFARVTFRNATGMATVAVWAECLPDFVGIAVGAPVAITLTREVGRDGTPEWRYKSIRPLPPNHAVAKEALPSCPVPRAKLNARTVALVAASDMIAAAKIVADLEKAQKVSLKGGLMDGQVLDPAGIKKLASMPGKQALRGMLVNVLAAPIVGFVRVIAEIEKKKNPSAVPADAPAA